MSSDRESTCPHCGAVNPISPAALLVHCAFCSSAYTFKDNRALLIGTVAIPTQTDSPFYIGQPGSIQGFSFQIRGHLRYRYSTGYWDEWCGVTAEGKVLWISEDEQEVSIFRREELTERISDLDQIGIGQIISVAGAPFMVEERDQAALAGFEGEIPFEIALERSFTYIAGIANEERITLEFSENGVERYRGKVVTLEYLGITPKVSNPYEKKTDTLNHNLDTEHASTTEPVKLNDSEIEKLTCTACGAPVKLTGNPAKTITVVCTFCGSALDARTSAVMARSNTYTPPRFALELGAHGTMSGQEVTVAGRIRMKEEDWHWDEYLLWCSNGEYRWLTDDSGSWSTSRRIRTAPAELPQDLMPGESITYQSQKFRIKEKTRGTVDFIDGEFPYYTAKGLTTSGFDAVSGTRKLSCEWNTKEIEWYAGDSISAERIKGIFGLTSTPRAPQTEGNKQQSSWSNGAVVTLIIAIIALVILTIRETQIESFTLEESEYSDSLNDDGFAEREITIPAKGNYRFKYTSNLNDNWLFFTTEIQDSAKRPLMQFGSDMSYYSGTEGGESWSEGSQNHSQILSFSHPGRYTLLFSGENESSTPSVQVSIYKNAFVVRYLVILIALCIIIIIIDLNNRGIINFTNDD